MKKRPSGLQEVEDANLQLLRKKTNDILKTMGSATRGVFYYAKGSKIQVDYAFKSKASQITTAAKGPNDEEAEAKTHQKFHLKAALVIGEE